MRLVGGYLGTEDTDAALERFDAIADRTDATLQAFDARYLVGPTHLERARDLADRAIERGEAVAEDRSMEILLYAAGRRQINRALEMGLKSTDHPVMVLVDGGDEERAAAAVEDLLEEAVDPSELEGDRARIRTFFDVTDAELGTGADLEALVIERVALLAVNR